jgi:hypothetical protein
MNRIYWREDNTEGHSEAEVDALEEELQARLATLGECTEDERQAVIKQFADEVARR